MMDILENDLLTPGRISVLRIITLDFVRLGLTEFGIYTRLI